jgi:hypothetical protein
MRLRLGARFFSFKISFAIHVFGANSIFSFSVNIYTNVPPHGAVPAYQKSVFVPAVRDT